MYFSSYSKDFIKFLGKQLWGNSLLELPIQLLKNWLHQNQCPWIFLQIDVSNFIKILTET